MFRFVHIILAAAMVAVAAPQASAIDLFNKDMIEPDKRVPACDDASVHRRIQRKFAHADREYYRGIESIEAIEQVRQLALVANRPSPLVRRYCRAQVLMSDQHTRTMYYLIEEESGFVAWTHDVEFCIQGLDRWRVNDAHCRTVRP